VFVARGHRTIGKASFRWAMVFAGAGFLYVIETDGITCDTRVFPPPESPPKPLLVFELIVRGTYRTYGKLLSDTFGDRTALALRHEHYQGASGERAFAFRADGRPLVIVEWHAPLEVCGTLGSLPAVLHLDEATWAAAARAGLLSEATETDIEEGLRELVTRLAKQGVVTEDGASKALRDPPAYLARLWRALKPTIEHLALSVTAADLGASADLSASQVERALRRWATAFAVVGPGLKTVTRTLRLNIAVMFLSAEGVSVADVALATGYASADAMARAFRDAGLAPPSAVQKTMRGSEGDVGNIGSGHDPREI
jgi:AraC-like DNA-binding protein